MGSFIRENHFFSTNILISLPVLLNLVVSISSFIPKMNAFVLAFETKVLYILHIIRHSRDFLALSIFFNFFLIGALKTIISIL